MFGFLKNKDAEEVASEINRIHNQIYKLAKKNTDGTYSISKKVIEKDFKSNKIETTKNGTAWKISKKETKWTMFVGETIVNYSIHSKNKDELDASYTAISMHPGYYFLLCLLLVKKNGHLLHFFQCLTMIMVVRLRKL